MTDERSFDISIRDLRSSPVQTIVFFCPGPVRSAENVVLGPMESGPWIPDAISLFQTFSGQNFGKFQN